MAPRLSHALFCLGLGLAALAELLPDHSTITIDMDNLSGPARSIDGIDIRPRSPAVTTSASASSSQSFPPILTPSSNLEIRGVARPGNKKPIRRKKTEADSGPSIAPPAPPSGPAIGCVTAHTYMSNCIFGGDTMSVQLWEKGVKVCDGGKGQNMASRDTVFNIDCHNGGSVRVGSNGFSLTYTPKGGAAIKLANEGRDKNLRTHCGDMGTHQIHGSEFEAVFSNGQCDKCPKAQLCDFRSYCSFDGACH
ncbi:hypothetical protein ANO11243_094330 [Dothideomycetidae sp. 11243]|nr:hypothetical protein ANO11243_094330 [fungal sp. No.11243]